MEPTYSPDAVAPLIGGCFLLVIIAISLIASIITLVAFCKICGKAGYHWALGFLMLIPVGNFVLLLILAFGEWPIHRQLRACPQGGTNPPSGQPYQNFRGL